MTLIDDSVTGAANINDVLKMTLRANLWIPKQKMDTVSLSLELVLL